MRSAFVLLLLLAAPSAAAPPPPRGDGPLGFLEVEAYWAGLAWEKMADRPLWDWWRLAEASADWLWAEQLEHTNPRKSAAMLTKATATVEALLGQGHLYTSNCYSKIIWAHMLRSDYAAALPLCQKLVRSYEGTGLEGGELHLTAMSHLALAYQEMGDVQASLPLSRQVVRLALEKYGKGSDLYHMTLNNLGLAAQRAGHLHEAFACIATARDLRKRYLPAGHPLQAYGANNLAYFYQLLGEPRLALPLFEEALEIRRRAYGTRHPEYATSLNNLAWVKMELGRHAEAKRALEEVLELLRDTVGERQAKYSFTLHNIARMYAMMGRPSAALPVIERCLTLLRRNLELAAPVVSERQLLAAANRLRDPLWLRLSLPEESAELSHAHVIGRKGFVFARQQQRRLFARLAGTSSETRALAAELLGLTRQLASLPGTARARAEADRLTRRKEEIEQRLAALSDDFRAGLRAPTSAELAAALPDGAVLLDFMAYRYTDGHAPSDDHDWERRLAVWVLRKGVPAARVELGAAGPIEEAAARWRTAIEKGRAEGRDPALLRRLLWAPLAKHVAGAKVVLIAPDEGLARLPWAALPGSKPGTYLIEDVALAVVPVPRLLPRVLATAGGDAPASLLVAGAVDFGEGRWQELPATGPEAESLAGRFKAAFRREAKQLMGAAVTKEALLEQLPRHRFAHLATHGFFKPHVGRKRDDDSLAGWHPGLLSGLVLARANDPKVADGVLTALEVAETDLSGMELAVLSACETGLGKEAGGEGLLGLQRAFQIAGCRSVVSSLWSVHDAATGVLMERFYFHLWEKKLSRLEALRQAQLDVLRGPGLVRRRLKDLVLAVGPKAARGLRGIGEAVETDAGERSPPAWWAAWQLSGDWR